MKSAFLLSLSLFAVSGFAASPIRFAGEDAELVISEAVDTGLPMMRALWLHYADDAEAVKLGDEYLWGRDVLVAPIVAKGAKSRRVYLSAGTWFDWWTGKKKAGNGLGVKSILPPCRSTCARAPLSHSIPCASTPHSLWPTRQRCAFTREQMACSRCMTMMAKASAIAVAPIRKPVGFVFDGMTLRAVSAWNQTSE